MSADERSAVNTRMKMLRTAFFLVGIVAVVACIAAAAPDLVVARIDVDPPDALPGMPVALVATIGNIGSAAVDGAFFVRFAVNDREIDVVAVPSGLDAGASVAVAALWMAEPGAHIVRVDVDRPDRVGEADETNNFDLLALTIPFGGNSLGALPARSAVVARFTDESKSGFVNVEPGVADKLTRRLRDAGARMFERSELEAIMQAHGLNPSIPADLLAAARTLGAELLITGSVRNVSFLQAALHFGFLRLSSASVDLTVSSEVIDTRTGEVVSTASAEGHDKGASGFSVDLGELRSLASSSSLCAGGLRTERNAYAVGEAVPFAYRNGGPSGWFGVEVHSSTGRFLAWLGWQFIPTAGCSSWFWDQRDAAEQQMSPGIYTAKVWNGTAYVASLTFQVLPGQRAALPPVQEVTVGSPAFEQTIVGAALNRAIDQLAHSVLPVLQHPASSSGSPADVSTDAQAAARTGALSPSLAVREGQIAAVLPDGRIAVNIGAAAGVSVGDRFLVLAVENVIVDPISLRILDYDVLETKGRIEVLEVRERVAYARRLDDFEPTIGDVIRLERL